ncbi:POK6 protein, partial [Mystacornis crossleyi]|nr:POK6 protein [Mystacornis crossleyi]
LSQLFNILKGDLELSSRWKLSPEAQQVLQEVQQAIFAHQVYEVDPSIDITVYITTPDFHPTGIIGKWNNQWSDPLHI